MRGRLIFCDDLHIPNTIANCNKLTDKNDPSDVLKHKFGDKYEGFNQFSNNKNNKYIFLIIIAIILIYLITRK